MADLARCTVGYREGGSEALEGCKEMIMAAVDARRRRLHERIAFAGMR
jgi:hypothetical protein